MRTSTTGRRARIAALAASAVVVSPLAIGTMSAQADEVPEIQTGETKTYIVQLADDPLVAFDGGHGLTATAPKDGEKVDVDSAAANAYTDYLAAQRAEVLASVGLSTSDLVTTYEVALNGFAVKMNGAEAIHMQKAPGVLNVWEDEVRYADTVQTPDYLGLSGETGVWANEFGGVENAGDGVIVGVIDTGIDPNNPSFDPTGMPAAPEDWEGICQESGVDEGGTFECNNKVIGARWYGAEYGNTIIPSEYESARDRNGHGSHTAGTAAGNNGVDMSILGADLGSGSGMAPRAHIAVYKGLWQTEDGRGSGTSAGLVAAIDDATADGVDVINYSVSGSSQYIVTADEIAFMFAADAGIFVSTSAGNSGDTVGVSSVAHNAPWTITVAASTHNRGALNSVTLGNEMTYEGVGYGGPLEATDLVYAGDIPADGAAASEAELCAPGTVNDADAAGKVVICLRGAYALVDKAGEVIDSDGAGMVLINDPAGAGGQNAIIYGLPATHLLAEDGQAVKAYAQGEDAPTAAISATTPTEVNAPQMASFSSYGPAIAGGGDLLKPDITAPGVDVAAAYHGDYETGDPTFDQISGTSMSAPHIAGLGALMKQKYPDWSPMAIKSAMMTTARDTDDSGGPIQRGGADASPLDFGAGEVQPAPSYNPGLVYDSGLSDWAAYACAIGQLELAFVPGTCDSFPVIDPSDLNYPSISIGDLPGRQTVTRTVTDVSGAGGTYTFDIDAPAGTTVSVSPETLTVEPGGSATYTATITATDSAVIGDWTFGQLRLVDGDVTVESPIAVRPLDIGAPGDLLGEGPSGSIDYQVTPGFNGTLDTDIDGLIPSSATPVEVISDGPSGGASIADHIEPITVPEGTRTLRISIYDSEIDPAGTDMDLFLANSAGAVIAQSAAGGSDESITVHDVPAGTYLVALDYWNGAAGAAANMPLHVWAVTDADEGNMTVSPESAPTSIGDPLDLTVSWSGLSGHTRYLGNVNYVNSGEIVGKTVVQVDVGLGVERVAGESRYGTAAAIAAEYPEGADTVYIASGQAFADALTGSAAAGAGVAPNSQPMTTPDGQAAPVLLVKQDGIPQDTAAALEMLEPSNIVILGGTAAVSAGVEGDLGAYGTVSRIAGADRYETAALLAQEFPTGVSKVYVAVGEGNNFADALSASALAGSEGFPVLLTKSNHVPQSLAAALDALAPTEVVVIGGTSAVSEGVADQVGATSRLAGSDRYATNAEITAAYSADQGQAYVASGQDWPDALSGAALAGYMDAPLVLTKAASLPNVTVTELNRLSPAAVTIFGGTSAVSTDVQSALNELLPSWQ